MVNKKITSNFKLNVYYLNNCKAGCFHTHTKKEKNAGMEINIGKRKQAYKSLNKRKKGRGKKAETHTEKNIHI